MRRTLLIAALLLTTPLIGCLSGDDGGDGTQGDVQVDWTQRPQDMDAGQTMDVGWELTGPEGQITHTGLHYGPDSVEDPSSPSDYPESAGVTEPAQVPGEYDAQVTIEENGTYYFRAHAIVDGDHIWTDEVEITVEEEGAQAPVIVTITSAPDTTTVGENATVEWRLDGTPGNVSHTGFHWADFSVSDPSSPGDYSNSTGVQEPADVPGTYDGNVSETEPGTYHGRAHAIYDGQHYWSNEITLEFEAEDGDGPSEPTSNATIEIRDETALGTGVTYDPENVTVYQGGNVTWVNMGNATHGIDFEDDSIEDPGSADAGGTINWTVPTDLEPGTYNYTESETIAGLGDPQGQIVVKAHDSGTQAGDGSGGY